MKKTKFFKASALLLAVILCTAPLSGCNKSKSGEDGQITISIGATPNPDSSPVQYDTFVKKVARFEEKYPNIKVVGDEWSYDTKTFTAKAEGGTLPTIYPIPFTEVDKLRKYDYAPDITKYVKEYGLYDILSDYVMENVSENGKIYYLPAFGYTPYAMNLILNLKLFREAGLMKENDEPIIPQTYDELREMAVTIKEKTGKAGYLIPTTSNLGGWQFNVLAWAFGTKFITEKDGKYTASFDTPECVQALQYIKDMKWKYNTMPDNTLINWEEQVRLLTTDQCAMSIGNPDTVQLMVINYGMDPNDIGVAKLPAGPAERVTLVGGSYFSFSKNATPEEMDAAFKWLVFENDMVDFDESTKAAMETQFKDRLANGEIVGLKGVDILNKNSEYQAYLDELTDKYCNVPKNHIASFNDPTGIEYRSEEPVCTQDLYGLLDSCLQEVLTNKDADCAALISQANTDFQKNFLDYE